MDDGCFVCMTGPHGRAVFVLNVFTLYKYIWKKKIHINACRVSCGGVFNMLLVLSITFYFHYNIWGCMCSTGPFQYRWLKGYIYSSCYYHHQIGSIYLSHCYHIFPWLCAWDICYLLSLIAYTFRENREFVFIFIVQFMMSANSRTRFALQIVLVCLYSTPSHYHHCAKLSADIELIKWLSDIFCRVCD